MTIASFQQVHKRHGSVRALNGLSFELHPGEITCLLGPNGAGKSTAISLLLGLAKPDSGLVEAFGDGVDQKQVRRRIGCTPQNTDFPEHLKVKEVLSLVRAHYPRPHDIDTTLERFGLSSLRERKSQALSGGQRRCLALACAFIGAPDLVLLDEPTTGLDVDIRRRLWAVVRDFAARGGSVLLTTHYLEEAEELASRILLMKEGRIFREGDVRSIKAGLGLKQISFRCREKLRVAVSTTGPIAIDRGLYRVKTSEPDAFIRDLARLHDFEDLAVESLSLEDAFLHLLDQPQLDLRA